MSAPSKQRLLEALQRPAPYSVQVDQLSISAPPAPWTIPMAIPITVPAAVQRRMMKGKPAGVPRPLVKDVNIVVEPGQVCAIVGGSGSGKTTLLHAIAARESNLLHSGSVNYTPCSSSEPGTSTPSKRKSASTKVTAEKVVGFVAQNDDTLLPYLTVREQLSFAAALRLPTSVDSQTRKAIVEETLNELGLREVADVLVGGGLRKGISGGEKRRLNVACILVTLPSVLILDEPTTGLDSFTAFALLETLQNLAKRGRSIILSIHQPRSDAFRLLSKVVLLSQGSVVYSGPRIEMISHFKSLGYTPPDRSNPLDWVVDISSIDTRDDEAEAASRQRVGQLTKAWREHEISGGQVARLDSLEDGEGEAEEGADIEQGIQRTVSRGSTIKREKPQHRPNVIAQCWLLTGRGLRNVSRNYGQTVGSLLQAVLIGVGLGLAFYRPPQTPGGIQSLKTIVYQSSPAMYYLSTVVYIYILCDELVVFDREREDRLYEAVPAAIALFLSALPTAIIAPTIYAIIIYFMCGLRIDNLAVNLLSFVAQSIMQQLGAFTYALLAASINRSFAQASLLGNGFAIIFVLTSGYLITDLPVWISWSRWLSPYFYGFNWIARTQFIGRKFECDGVTGPARNACEGTAVLVGMRFNLTRPLLVYPLGLLGFILVSFMLATLLLTFYHPGGVKHATSKESKPMKAAEVAELEKEHLLEREGVDVKIEKLGLTVSSRSLLHPGRRQEKVILAEVNASFHRGEVSVIMGPSGAGKSSLLQILSSRLSGGLISDFSTTGSVLLNDQPLGPSTAALVSFVQQEDDHHLPALTVRETLRFAAKLRLRGKTSAQCDARAEEVLKMLGLSPCANNIVGGELLKGISGGERRRLSLAVEMLADPAVLLADEPLSGLDAFTARAVMETLKNLAIAGRTVVVSVHQPRGDIWEMFDNVLLLAKGGVTAFSGSRSAILEAFQAVGETCPTDFNPADFILDSISVDHRSDEAEVISGQRVDRIVQAWSDRKTSEAGSSLTSTPTTSVDNKRSKSPFVTAFPVVLQRSFTNLWRGKDALVARCINPPFMALLFWIFFGRLDYGPSSAQDRVGLIQETAALPFVGMLSCLAIFPIEKQLFLHEYNSSARQGVFTFLLGYTVQETVASIVSSLLFAIVFVYGMNMQHSARIFIEFWFTSWSLVSVGESFGIIFASFFSSGGLAVAVTSAMITILAQLNGVISVTLPFWLEVVGWISPMKPQVRVQTINEMKGLVFRCSEAQIASGACIAQTGEQLLHTFNIAPVDTAKFVGIAVALVILWRAVAFGALKLRTLTVSSEPYDPYIPGGNASQNPSGAPNAAGPSKTAAIQAQIDDTVGIMRENITKVAERGERLDALQDKTDNLAQSAQGFRKGANRVRKQMWWKDMKMRILIGVGIAVLVIIIVVPIVVKK